MNMTRTPEGVTLTDDGGRELARMSWEDVGAFVALVAEDLDRIPAHPPALDPAAILSRAIQASSTE